MKRPELLSPAGNMECLKAAINAGCDAVYLGGYTFGARNYAGNFSDEELIEAIKYAHTYGVKVYVTVNTIIYEDETERFINYIDFLHKNNVDAILIQDLGMMDYLKKVYPNLEVHASTQMNTHNFEGAKFLKELGLKRVVLARETDPKVIKRIKDELDVEVECFIHGALCFSYSGECLMSSLIGGRSGNRGTCAQCCRMEYDLYSDNKKINKDKYLLSMKDLNSLKNIDKLINMGIDSLKIEGRMKRPEYVYLITSIYRKAIDKTLKGEKFDIEKDILEMKKIFNREFTGGYINNEKDVTNFKRPNHIGINIGSVIETKNKVRIKLSGDIKQGDGIRIIGKKDTGCILNKIYKNKKLVGVAFKNDIVEIDIKEKVNIGDLVVKTTDKAQMDEINKDIDVPRKIKINASIKVKYNEPIELIFNDDKNEVKVIGNVIDKAINNPTDKDRIISQISKLGSTPFVLENIESSIDSDIFVNIKELNDLRRECVLKLIDKRQYTIPYLKKEYYIDTLDFPKVNNYSVLVNSLEDYNKIKNKSLENIYLEEDLYSKIDDDRKVLRISRINDTLKEYNENVLIGDIGALAKYKNKITDFGFNVTNSYTVAFLHSLGVRKITLAYELSDKQIENIINGYHDRYKKHPNLELIISSYPEAMISKFNLLKYYNLKNGYLTDKFNNKFKLKGGNVMTIYNYEKLEFKGNYFDMGVNSLRVHIEDEKDFNKIP